jgi:hypothetical protein
MIKKVWKTGIRILGLGADICLRKLPDTKQECQTFNGDAHSKLISKNIFRDKKLSLLLLSQELFCCCRISYKIRTLLYGYFSICMYVFSIRLP